jgi:hypothetical protein
MSCAAVDYLYAATLAVFAVTAGMAAWWHSSFAKVLELRHPAIHVLLGKPSPLRTAESDKHAMAMLRFILAGEYKSLNDEVVAKHARVLQACTAIGAVAAIAVAIIASTTSTPAALLAMHCWRGS